MASPTVEDYLKKIYALTTGVPADLVSLGKLATGMAVAPGTVTAMMKTLAESGLVHYEPRAGVRLTREGNALALHVLRRHRLVELLLVEVIGLDWSQVHDEAEVLEHAISDNLLEKIDQLLGHPSSDPHGDPIPSARGKLANDKLMRLDRCRPGDQLCIARVADEDPAFLRFAQRHGLKPGQRLTVEQHEPSAAAMTVSPQPGKPVTLGTSAASKIFVKYAT